MGTLFSLLVLGLGSVAAFATVQERLESKADKTDVVRVETKQVGIAEDIEEIKLDLKEILRVLRDKER